MSAQPDFTDLHDIIERVHKLYPSSLTLSLFEHSNNVQKACDRFATETSVDIGNFNRLKYMVYLFQTKKGDECKCGQSGTECGMFLFRSFLACGGYAHLARILLSDCSSSMWLVLGSSELQQSVHRWCLHLLWLLSLSTVQVFQRCWGGSAFSMTIVSYTIARVGLKQETEFTLSIDSCLGPKTRKKKAAVLVTFLEQLQSSLKGVIELPVLPTHKGSVQEIAELLKSSANVVFEFLSVPTQFYRMYRVDAARNLVCAFVELDIKPSHPTKGSLAQYVSDYVTLYRDAYLQKHRRNMSGIEFHGMVRMLIGSSLVASPDIVDDPELVIHEKVNFAISGLKETWMLSHILASIPTVPDQFATSFLRELGAFFNQQPQTRSKLIAEEPFVAWFFPVLFDQALEGNAHQSSEMQEIDRSRLGVFEIATDIIGGGIAYEILTRIRKKEDAKTVNDLKLTAEGLFVSALVQIGAYDANRTPWCKRNVEILQALANSVARKLVVAASSFRSSWKHPAWANVMEVLNAYRNMAWCCITPGTTASEPSEAQVMRALLQTTSSSKLPAPETVRVLLSEHIVSSLRECCRVLNIFDLGNVDDTSDDKKRVEALKGAGLAYTAFFRDCLSCMRTQRVQPPETKVKMMAQFVQTYVFKKAYVKEEEDRLALIHDTETRRRNTLLSRGAAGVEAEQDDRKQILRDLESLAAGVTVWQVPKRGNVQQCYLYLRSQANAAQGMGVSKTHVPSKLSAYTLVIEAGKEKSSLTLFEQATLELGVNDLKLLTKNELDYAMDMGLSMWKDKECRQFVCTSLEDYECCSRVLSYLRAQRIETTAQTPPSTAITEKKDIDYSELNFPLDMAKATLHHFVVLIHQFFPSEMNVAMLKYSQKINATTKSKDLGDLNRLRYLVHLIEGDCTQTILPCRACFKAEKAHDDSSSTCLTFFSFIECFCCKSPDYQGVNSTECLCATNTKDSCVMLTVKTFVAHGGRELLQGMLRDSSRAWYVHRWCFHLLWLLSNVNPLNFNKCWGGTRVKVHIESHSTARAGLKSETDFLIAVDLPLVKKKLTKKMNDVISFQEQLTLLLKGTVDLTGLSKPKGVSTEVPVTLQASMNTIFQFFGLPANFQMLARIVKARELFYDFLEISVNSQQLSRSTFTQILTDFTPLHREKRSMSGSIVRLLLRLLTGETMVPSVDIIDDALLIPREDISNFGVTKISEIWLLSHILRALPTVSDDVAVLVLREFNHFFLRQTAASKDVLSCADYIQWFFPIFFDRYSNENKQNVSVRGSWDCFYLSVNFLCIIQSNRILGAVPIEAKAGEPDSSEGMVANTVAAIGAFDGQSIGLQLTQWSKQHVEIVQAVLAGIAGKLGAAVSSFRSVLVHPAWANILDVLRVYRNMTCCVVSSSMARLLLSQGPATANRTPGEPTRALMSEQILLSVRSLLQGLRVFEITADAVDDQENIKLNNMKGAAHAYWGYFRECLSCFQTAKDYSSEDQEKTMCMFFQTYPFDLSYSKEEEIRLSSLEQNEVRRKRSAARTLDGVTTDVEKQFQRDFQTCNSGVFVWKLPNKKGGKVEGCFLYLRQEEDKLWRGGHLKHYITLQSHNNKKEAFVLFDKVTLAPDPNGAKIGVEFVQHEGLVLWQGSERTDLVCASSVDSNAVCDVLFALQDKRLQKEPSNSKLDSSVKAARVSTPSAETHTEEPVDTKPSLTGDLHATFVMVHETFSNSVSASMLDYSQRVTSVCKSPDLALFNRLRFLVSIFQMGCDQFSLPCRTCGKSEKVHGANNQCAKYVASEDSGVCVCGKTAGTHPWAISSPRECRCGSKDLCPLFPMKTFVAYGGKEFLQRILSDASRPFYLHRWCLHLLWLWCQVPSASFERCWGGTRVLVTVDSHSSVRAGIKSETEFSLTLEGSVGTNIVRKKMPVLVSFAEGMREAMKGVLDLPALTVLKGNAGEMAEDMKTGLNNMFQMLNTTENFNKLLRVDKARVLFTEFLENDLQTLQVNKTTFAQFVSQFTLSHREEFNRRQTRTMANISFQYLISLLTNIPLLTSSDIISDIKNFPREPFVLSPPISGKLAEPWLLSYILPSVPTISIELAMSFLKELNDFFIVQPLVRSCLLVEDALLLWVLPVLFDSDESNSSSNNDDKKLSSSGSNEESSSGTSRKEVMEMTVELLSSGIMYEVLTRRSPAKKVELKGLDQLKTTPEGLLATTIVQIGTFADAKEPIWSHQHIEVLQALCSDFVDKLIPEILAFNSSLQHPGWVNVLECLNVYRQMTYCMVIPNPVANETQDSQVVRILLGSGPPTKTTGAEISKVLLSEHILSTICQLLSTMNLFELVTADKSSEEANRLKMIKGAGLAFTEYFRGCLACFRTVRGSSPEEQAKVIAQFVATFVMNKNYSKEVESRLKALEDSESSRKMTMISTRATRTTADANTLLHDLDVLGTGVSVWLLPKKGKMQQFYLYLKRDEQGKVGKAPSYHLILELQTTRKKSKYSIPKEASLELGTYDANLLISHGLVAANSAGLILTQGKTKTDLVCTSWDDYGSWTRVLPALSSNSLPTEGAAPPRLRTGFSSGSANSSSTPVTPKREHTRVQSLRDVPTSTEPSSPCIRPAIPPPSPSPMHARAQSFVHIAPTSPETRASVSNPAPPPRTSVASHMRAQSFVNTAPTSPESRNGFQGVDSVSSGHNRSVSSIDSVRAQVAHPITPTSATGPPPPFARARTLVVDVKSTGSTLPGPISPGSIVPGPRPPPRSRPPDHS